MKTYINDVRARGIWRVMSLTHKDVSAQEPRKRTTLMYVLAVSVRYCHYRYPKMVLASQTARGVVNTYIKDVRFRGPVPGFGLVRFRGPVPEFGSAPSSGTILQSPCPESNSSTDVDTIVFIPCSMFVVLAMLQTCLHLTNCVGMADAHATLAPPQRSRNKAFRR